MPIMNMRTTSRCFSVLLLVLLGTGCGFREGSQSVMEDYEYDRQVKQYQEQLDRIDAQLDRVDRHNARYQKILEKWEEQQRKVDYLLNAIASQNGIAYPVFTSGY